MCVVESVGSQMDGVDVAECGLLSDEDGEDEDNAQEESHCRLESRHAQPHPERFPTSELKRWQEREQKLCGRYPTHTSVINSKTKFLSLLRIRSERLKCCRETLLGSAYTGHSLLQGPRRHFLFFDCFLI